MEGSSMRIRLAYLLFLTLYPVWAAADKPPVHIPSEGWTLVLRQDGIVVQERSIPGSPKKAYRAKGILKAPIEQILEVLSDTTAAAEWMPDLDRQQVVAAVSDVEMITLSVYAVPFPFADRELLLHNYLRLDRPGGALVAETVSIDQPNVSIARRHVRAHMLYGKTWLRPLDTDRTGIEFVIIVDPRGRIPDFLAAFGLRRMPLKFVRALESRAQSTQYPLRPAYRDLLRQLAETDDGKQSLHGENTKMCKPDRAHYIHTVQDRVP
jgi:hypothetical protein